MKCVFSQEPSRMYELEIFHTGKEIVTSSWDLERENLGFVLADVQ